MSPSVGCSHLYIHRCHFVLLGLKADNTVLSHEGRMPSRPRHCSKGMQPIPKAVQFFL